MNIKITDNEEEILVIGKEILQEKSKIYSPKMVEVLKNTIDKYKDVTVSDEEKEKLLYRAIYDYWVYGNSCDEEFYYNFTEKTHNEKKKYITFRLREKYCKYLNKDGNREVLVDKYKAYLKFKEYYLRDVIEVNGIQDYEIFEAFVKKHSKFVVKPKDMAFGIGVYLVSVDNQTNLKILFQQILESGRKNKEEITWAKSESLVLEEVIKEDERISRIHPDSVNGVRVTTIKHNDEIKIYKPWLKIGVDHQFVTSAVFGTMDAGIDVETGKVSTNGFKENGEEFEYHPNTGIKIPGFVIPRWKELIALAKKVGGALEGINYVGWDFVLTPNGWCIMEANYDGDAMWQLFEQKGDRDDFERMIGWEDKKLYWWQE